MIINHHIPELSLACGDAIQDVSLAALPVSADAAYIHLDVSRIYRPIWTRMKLDTKARLKVVGLIAAEHQAASSEELSSGDIGRDCGEFEVFFDRRAEVMVAFKCETPLFLAFLVKRRVVCGTEVGQMRAAMISHDWVSERFERQRLVARFVENARWWSLQVSFSHMD